MIIHSLYDLAPKAQQTPTSLFLIASIALMSLRALINVCSNLSVLIVQPTLSDIGLHRQLFAILVSFMVLKEPSRMFRSERCDDLENT